ncbi:acyl-CoA dehydrogenase family protein [Variovorax humicola]|uniref:Acyl-CoA dehydrogenase family protein n=1 Tax=Variovorax humicola TaxID=1769758 RepID=A0ABU8W604_9BURK
MGGLERFYRDVRAFRIHKGTSQVHQIGIGKALLRNAAQAEPASRGGQLFSASATP